jgi:hypothetical protein
MFWDDMQEPDQTRGIQAKSGQNYHILPKKINQSQRILFFLLHNEEIIYHLRFSTVISNWHFLETLS